MAAAPLFQHILHRSSLKLRRRGQTLRTFARQLGLVYFGLVDQHHDEHSPVRGFTASLTHRDSHYAVGTYNGFDIRLLNRFDVIKDAQKKSHGFAWTIIEVRLERRDLPHMFFMPTGKDAPEYARLFRAYPHLQPLNTMIGTLRRSPELHGRYQILARTTHSREVERLFDSPTIVSIGTRLWPQGLEIHGDRLFIYLPQELTKQRLELCLDGALWFAEQLDEE